MVINNKKGCYQLFSRFVELYSKIDLSKKDNKKSCYCKQMKKVHKIYAKLLCRANFFIRFDLLCLFAKK